MLVLRGPPPAQDVIFQHARRCVALFESVNTPHGLQREPSAQLSREDVWGRALQCCLAKTLWRATIVVHSLEAPPRLLAARQILSLAIRYCFIDMKLDL